MGLVGGRGAGETSRVGARPQPLLNRERVGAARGHVTSPVRNSRTHALFSWRDDGLWVTDPGSAWGVFVGEERLTPGEPRRLASADWVRFGELAFELTIRPAE